RRLALESTRDVTERKASERRQHVLAGELAHRVRNTLTVVQAIAHETARHASEPRLFVAQFEERLAALGRAHNLLIDSDWHGADLVALARGQLAPFVGEGSSRVAIEGESMILPSDLVTPLALALHELAGA